jgi:hypothetical protein
MTPAKEIAAEGAIWLVCAALGTAVNLELWPSIPIVLVVFTTWAAASALRRAGR